MFALVDCNNFYASCERVFNPKWRNKPLVVLSNNDGCVIARSNEAKALGIPMGAPYFQFKQLIQAHNVIVCSSNYTLYGDMSARVMKTLEQFTPEMQVYSIDEAFLALQEKNLNDQGVNIRKTIIKWTGIPVSIGIAKTKTLAKIANHHAKKNQETGGVYVLDENNADDLLDALPVTEIWGIGGRLGKRLNRLGIITAKDYREADDSLIRKHLTIVGLRTAHELRGVSCLPLEEVPPPKKSVTCSRAFGRPIDTLDELSEAIATYAARAGEKIREQGSLATEMTVFIERHPFKKDSPGFFHVRTTFPQPTDYTPHLIHYAKQALAHLFKKENQYRKAGIILDGLVPDNCFQLDLFTQSSTKQKKLMKVIDQINEEKGFKALHTAAEGVNKGWTMKQNLRTAHFTTSWKELLKIKI